MASKLAKTTSKSSCKKPKLPVFDLLRMDEAFRAQQTESAWRVVVKRRGSLSIITYPFNPLDALGWHGTLAPVSSTGAT